MASGPVFATTEEQDDDEQDDHHQGDHAKDLHPAGSAGVGASYGASVGLPVLVRHRPSPSLGVVADFTRQNVLLIDGTYTKRVPKLWNETIEAHRRVVRDAILETTAALVAEHGLRSVTMSQIAEETGIGRATLYKYFAGVEAILLAWHERKINAHLAYLAEVRDDAGDADQRLEAVLEAYAFISHASRGRHDDELTAFLHRDEHGQVERAQQQLRAMIRELLADGAQSGRLRDDVTPDELANYCLHALAGASSLPSEVAVRRLVRVTLAGLRPER
jgi:AcrR family transcriptional regulator